ncbi:uncharacterized protein RAG0_12596 [Rhynchosporium agropyri]|uniref:Uncharacterized protein n=1 Tax=Rhynchosporium agropyri TaxID=914238 RepID=A0A1E1L8X5_9HELO|nr:uncharacterized protein RAG0_12596 [Rhynchosporium agropyri]
MRIVWNAKVLQEDEKPIYDSTCIDLHDLHSMFAQVCENRAESFLPSQKIASTVTKEQVEDPGYTLTIEYTSALPLSLFIDTTLPPSGSTLSKIPTSTSSSFARFTSLPMIAAIVPPAAMMLPQLNR